MGKAAIRFGEVVLRTSQYKAMKSWYRKVLETDPMFESERKKTNGIGPNEAKVHFPTLLGISFHRDTGDPRCFW